MPKKRAMASVLCPTASGSSRSDEPARCPRGVQPPWCRRFAHRDPPVASTLRARASSSCDIHAASRAAAGDRAGRPRLPRPTGGFGRRPPARRPGCRRRSSGSPTASGVSGVRVSRSVSTIPPTSSLGGSRSSRCSVHAAQIAPGGRGRRRPRHEDHRRQRGGEVGIAGSGQRLGDRGVWRQHHRIRRHQPARGVGGVGQQPSHRGGFVRDPFGSATARHRSDSARRAGRRHRRDPSPRARRPRVRCPTATTPRPDRTPAAPAECRPADRRPAP